MRLVRYGSQGDERVGALLDEEHVVDVSDLSWSGPDSFLGGQELAVLRDEVARRSSEGLVVNVAGVRWGAPIPRPHQILCIGLNYRDHAAETGQEIPKEPILFTKSPNTLVGPHDVVRIPRTSEKTDWEVELGVVVGARASYLASPDVAGDFIAGYVLVNDVSERAFQIERGGQWSKGKSCPTFNPCGPWLLTADEFDVGVPRRLWASVNGETYQDGTTAEMVFDPHYLVWYLSQFMALEPGDLINTGTPAGVGMGQQPPRYLRDGDVVELGIDGLGVQRQVFRDWDADDV